MYVVQAIIFTFEIPYTNNCCVCFMHDDSCCTCVEVSLVASVVAVMAFVGFDVVVVVIVVVALVEFGAPGDTRRTWLLSTEGIRGKT